MGGFVTKLVTHLPMRLERGMQQAPSRYGSVMVENSRRGTSGTLEDFVSEKRWNYGYWVRNFCEVRIACLRCMNSLLDSIPTKPTHQGHKLLFRSIAVGNALMFLTELHHNGAPKVARNLEALSNCAAAASIYLSSPT